MMRKDGRITFPRGTICASCGEKIGQSSHSCPAPSFLPRHFSCVYGKDLRRP